MADVFYSSLDSIISLDKLPAQLTFVSNNLNNLFSKIYFRNLDAKPLSSGSAMSYEIEIIVFEQLSVEIPGTGFILLLNRDIIDPSNTEGLTVIPLSFTWSWGILTYIRDFNSVNFSSSAEDFFDIIMKIAEVPDEDLLLGTVDTFIVDSNPLNQFVTQINLKYGLSISLPLNTDIEIAINDILSGINQHPTLSLQEIVFQDYIFDSLNVENSLVRINALFNVFLGEDAISIIKKLIVPQITANMRLTASLVIPRTILTPVNNLNEVIPNSNTKLDFNIGEFTYSTDGGFGFEGENSISSSPSRAQIGNSGFIIDLDKSIIKLDLNEKSNITEAETDNRPENFRGFYISNVKLFLPKDWQLQGNPVEIHGYNLLIGTGGFSGTLGIAGTNGLPKPPSTDPNNPLLSVNLFNDVTINFNSFDVTFQQDEVIHSNVKGKFSIQSLKGPNNQPAWFNFDLLFNANGFQLIFDDPAKAVNVILGNTVKLSISRLVIGRDNGDLFMGLTAVVEMQQQLPFIGKVLPKKIKFDRLLLSQDSIKNNFAANVEWPDGTKVSGNLDTGLDISVALQKVILDTIRVDLIRLRLKQSGNKTEALITTNTQLKLGPMAEFADPKTKRDANGFVAIIEDFGLKLSFVPNENGGNVGVGELDVRVKYPKGIGIHIDTQNVKGGGFLSYDEAKGEYIGVAALKIRDKIDLKAIGILTTKKTVPTDPEYSLFLLITAEGFTPIPLGMDFKLIGVGGLVGINRSLNEQRLRQGVQDNSLSQLLFPKDPVKNAPQIVATAGQAFPVANGRYAFGLMGKIAWGPNALITLDVGLVIEVPSPVRLAILGVLKAVLPSEDQEKLKLQVNFLGFIDFDKKQVSFDASLFDSKLLDSALTGDMAFRLYQGSNPVFLVTVGGFHPAFSPPPANLPTLRRLTMTVVNKDNFKMIMTSYFALTSNTVQFGSRLDMRASIGDFTIVGYFNFDTLFQFNPFQLILDIAAEVAIKYGSQTLLSLYLSLHLDGPSPWHVTGKASFKAFGLKVEKSIDRTIGNHRPEPQIASVNVRQQLVAALSDVANWEVEKGPNTFELVTTRPVTPTPGTLFVNPAGQLVVSQKFVPLKLRFDKFGNSVPVNGNEFDITQATFGIGGAPAPISPVDDAFAPAQYRTMSNNEKLSAPSFQRMQNGVRFRATESSQGGVGYVKAMAYEVVVLEKAEPENLPLDQADAGFQSVGPLTAPFLPTQHMFRGMARRSAASRSSLSQEKTAPSKLAPDGVYWDQDRYAVVRKSDLSYYGANAEYANEAEAEAYLRKTLASSPELENELQVIPVYELDHQMEVVA